VDYQRLVSYIYSYPEGVKGRNAGFAKALVHQGQFKLSISLRGVKTDSPEMFGIYMMVADSGYKVRGMSCKNGTDGIQWNIQS
jgi:hypothetical protein